MYNDDNILTNEQIEKLSLEYSQPKVKIYQNENIEGFPSNIAYDNSIIYYISYLRGLTSRRRVRNILDTALTMLNEIYPNYTPPKDLPKIKGSFNQKLSVIQHKLLNEVQMSMSNNPLMAQKLISVVELLNSIYRLPLL